MATLRSTLAAPTLCALVALATPDARCDTVWSTNDDIPTIFYSQWNVKPCSQGPVVVGEAADDFNVVGTVEALIIDGQECQGCGSLTSKLVGVNVRFYEWTDAGPGALQAEHYVPKGDPDLVWSPACCLKTVTVTLPEPFEASGLHYCSVQVVLNGAGTWEIVRVNVGDTMAGETYHRTAAGPWEAWSEKTGVPPVDLSFQLVGTISRQPTLQILTVTSSPIAPSARLRIDGVAFGDHRGSRDVRVDGLSCPVTQWTDGTIIAYVPEQVGLGAQTLAIVDAITRETLAQKAITVVARPTDERVMWRFAVDADYMQHRPGAGPDGSVYMNDVKGRLYKVNAQGGLEWIVDALRGQIGLGAEGPVVVSDAGVAIVAVNPLGPTTDLVAYDSDGNLMWEFIDPDSLGVAVGPAIGPDGNVYVAFHDQDLDSYGITSLTPDGFVRWTNNGDPPLYEHGSLGAELVFGASAPGGPVDQVVLTVDRDFDAHLYAFDMGSGEQRWAVPRGVVESGFLQYQIQPETGPDGTIYMTEFTGLGGQGWALWAIDPANGQKQWFYDPNILADASGPECGSDGTIYFSWDISRVGAVSPSGQGIWTHVDFGGVRTQPSVSPNNAFVLVGGGLFGQSGTFKTLDAQTGTELWKVQLPDENGNIVPDNRPLISSDSTRAYYPTVILADPEPFQYCYVYALALADQSVVGDLDGDGAVDGADLATMLGAWGRCGACEADLDGNGVVDGADLAMLLGAWSV